ncbi:MAG: hypothetical protein KKE39_02735 [Bacteroidetes bacterium]|nr:hypothetical protein [Bacteroidota bacterium]MBU1372248.1 hypothetical protein [Bacteroidota bacterium]MBU1484499.1 hypothetical protein [Bacteroidota bacterium]MBU1759719.1 hypothetical protein [Bacteroidota bacterium]MBU2046616.1 hypothetical protein [Bacteroidota bacterium]
MNKHDFTPLGMQQLLAALYALNDEALAAEAAALQNDFNGWCMLHFNLDSQQLSYLMGIDQQMQVQLSSRGSYYLKQRGAINLMQVNQNPLLKGDGDSAKIFNLNEQQNSTYSPDTGYQNLSSLNIQVTYPAGS